MQRLQWNRWLPYRAAAAALFGNHAGLGSNIPPGGGVLNGGAGMMPMLPPTLQVTFGQPEGMQVRYDATGGGGFDSEPLVVPARQNFPQGGLYRIKLTNIPAREGVELYPTVELAYANPRTGAYLAHNSVPIQFTEEDFDQVLDRQLCHEGHLLARSRLPRSCACRYRHVGQHTT